MSVSHAIGALGLQQKVQHNGLISSNAELSQIANPSARGPIRYVLRLAPLPAAFVESGFTLLWSPSPNAQKDLATIPQV